MSTLSIRIPEHLHKHVKSLAANEKISINQFVTLALAEKISAITTEEFIEERAKRASREKFLRAMEQVPDDAPDDYDKL